VIHVENEVCWSLTDAAMTREKTRYAREKPDDVSELRIEEETNASGKNGQQAK
jgi:hypothetical protein